MKLFHAIRAVVADQIEQIRTINRRYAKPRLTMSPAVQWALLALRIYLLVLVGLLVYKFITLLTP
jgi:hypothetical protein